MKPTPNLVGVSGGLAAVQTHEAAGKSRYEGESGGMGLGSAPSGSQDLSEDEAEHASGLARHSADSINRTAAAALRMMDSSLKGAASRSTRNRGGSCATAVVIESDWLSLQCSATAATAEFSHVDAPNAVDRALSKKHHRVFVESRPWLGPASNFTSEELLVDFPGFIIPRALYCNRAYMIQPTVHALRARHYSDFLPPSHQRASSLKVQTAWLVMSEEYFEYADILSAAADYAKDLENAQRGGAKRPFCFVELGAGYGHWTFAAHKAPQQAAPGAPHRYLMVEAVPSLKPAVEKLESLNGVSPGSASFHVGFVAAADSTKGFGGAQISQGNQMIKAYKKVWGTGGTSEDGKSGSQTVGLVTLFDMYHLPGCVDMLDVDIPNTPTSRARKASQRVHIAS